MPTNSFDKDFVIKDRKLARKILRDLEENKITFKFSENHAKVKEALARGRELLKKLSPTKTKHLNKKNVLLQIGAERSFHIFSCIEKS